MDTSQHVALMGNTFIQHLLITVLVVLLMVGYPKLIGLIEQAKSLWIRLVAIVIPFLFQILVRTCPTTICPHIYQFIYGKELFKQFFSNRKLI